MDYLDKLKELLNEYIKRLENDKGNDNINLIKQHQFEELLQYLEQDYDTIKKNTTSIAFLLIRLYKNRYYLSEFYSLMVDLGENEESAKRLNSLIERISYDYERIKEDNLWLDRKVSRKEELLHSAKRVLLSIENSLLISDKPDINNIKRILNLFETNGRITNKEELLLINELEMYNRRIGINDAKPPEVEYFNGLYNEVPNILNAGFQQHDVIEVSDDRKKLLDNFADEIYSYLDFLDKDTIIKTIKQYKKFKLDDNEYNYIIVRILNRLLDDLLTFYELLTEKEVYHRYADRKDVIKNYYLKLDKYLLLRSYYESLNSRVVEEEITPSEDAKRLIYAHSNVTPDKTRLLTDMANIPYEYYDTVSGLLTRFKTGSIGIKELKSLKTNKNLSSFIELKKDQVVVILTHLKEDIYVVVGAFAKKSDNDRSMYNSIFNRPIPKITSNDDLELYLKSSEETEASLMTLIMDKSRKGTR